jgi:hypothetical protein
LKKNLNIRKFRLYHGTFFFSFLHTKKQFYGAGKQKGKKAPNPKETMALFEIWEKELIPSSNFYEKGDHWAVSLAVQPRVLECKRLQPSLGSPMAIDFPIGRKAFFDPEKKITPKIQKKISPQKLPRTTSLHLHL